MTPWSAACSCRRLLMRHKLNRVGRMYDWKLAWGDPGPQASSGMRVGMTWKFSRCDRACDSNDKFLRTLRSVSTRLKEQERSVVEDECCSGGGGERGGGDGDGGGGERVGK